MPDLLDHPDPFICLAIFETVKAIQAGKEAGRALMQGDRQQGFLLARESGRSRMKATAALKAMSS